MMPLQLDASQCMQEKFSSVRCLQMCKMGTCTSGLGLVCVYTSELVIQRGLADLAKNLATCISPLTIIWHASTQAQFRYWAGLKQARVSAAGDGACQSLGRQQPGRQQCSVTPQHLWHCKLSSGLF